MVFTTVREIMSVHRFLQQFNLSVDDLSIDECQRIHSFLVQMKMSDNLDEINGIGQELYSLISKGK